jgi:replication initiation and membrane attachment protein DnaB
LKFEELNPELVALCQTADHFHMAETVIGSPLRGLDILSLKGIERKKNLPVDVTNLLIIYFFTEVKGTVYHRNALAKLYNHWVSNEVFTFSKAQEMVKLDMQSQLGEIDQL